MDVYVALPVRYVRYLAGMVAGTVAARLFVLDDARLLQPTPRTVMFGERPSDSLTKVHAISRMCD